jgi:hypothetical protein
LRLVVLCVVSSGRCPLQMRVLEPEEEVDQILIANRIATSSLKFPGAAAVQGIVSNSAAQTVPDGVASRYEKYPPSCVLPDISRVITATCYGPVAASDSGCCGSSAPDRSHGRATSSKQQDLHFAGSSCSHALSKSSFPHDHHPEDALRLSSCQENALALSNDGPIGRTQFGRLLTGHCLTSDSKADDCSDSRCGNTRTGSHGQRRAGCDTKRSSTGTGSCSAHLATWSRSPVERIHRLSSSGGSNPESCDHLPRGGPGKRVTVEPDAVILDVSAPSKRARDDVHYPAKQVKEASELM